MLCRRANNGQVLISEQWTGANKVIVEGQKLGARFTSSVRLPFPVTRRSREYVGQKFDQHQQLLLDDDSDQLGQDVMCMTDNKATQHSLLAARSPTCCMNFTNHENQQSNGSS